MGRDSVSTEIENDCWGKETIEYGKCKTCGGSLTFDHKCSIIHQKPKTSNRGFDREIQLGSLVRELFTSGNDVPVERIVIRRKDVEDLLT